MAKEVVGRGKGRVIPVGWTHGYNMGPTHFKSGALNYKDIVPRLAPGLCPLNRQGWTLPNAAWWCHTPVWSLQGLFYSEVTNHCWW